MENGHGSHHLCTHLLEIGHGALSVVLRKRKQRKSKVAEGMLDPCRSFEVEPGGACCEIAPVLTAFSSKGPSLSPELAISCLQPHKIEFVKHETMDPQISLPTELSLNTIQPSVAARARYS